MKFKRTISFILSLVMICSLAQLPAYASDGPQVSEPFYSGGDGQQTVVSDEDQGGIESFEELADREPVDPASLQLRPLEQAEGLEAGDDLRRDDLDAYAEQMAEFERQANEIVPVIVMLDEPAVVDQTANAAAAPATIALSDELEDGQTDVIADIEAALGGEALEITDQYTWLLNGFATSVRYGDIAAIEAVDGVKAVAVQRVFHTTAAEPTETESGVMPITNSDGPMIGRPDAWADGYKGKGMKIAIVDTGLELEHPSFAPLASDMLEDPLTAADIEAVASKLHAKAAASSLYRNTKVPFAYNYIDQSLRVDHNDKNGEPHGTHVAGIAAANETAGTEVVGVAPLAQILVMKVFGQGGGAYDKDILAALEDALMLGADVINMSLGTDAGFTTEGRSEIDEVYSKVSSTGTILAASAGNSGSSGDGNLLGTNTNLAEDPDDSTVGSPSTYGSALSVASVNNVRQTGRYIEGRSGGNKVTSIYLDTGGEKGSDGTVSPNARLYTLGGNSYGFALVTNYGASVADYASAKGKIALVQRGGGVNFTDKADNAAKAGAVACVVYNNAAGTISMALNGCKSNIPCVSITQADGEALKAMLASDPNAQIYVSKQDEIITLDTDDGYTMSSFSAWGVAPDLSLKPDITAPGGNIYSTVAGKEYDTMSGTSMAAPNLAGISALVMQFVKKNYPARLTDTNHDFINSLLMSAAGPLEAGDGLYYSPR